MSMTLIYSNRVVFGFTVICQTGNNSSGVRDDISPDYYLLNTLNVAWMFTSTAIGMCLGPLPFYIFKNHNTRALIFVYGIVSSMSSLAYPLADHLGFWPAFVCRFFAGFAQASQLQFTNDIVLRWAPQSESSFFFSIMLSTSQIGPLITMILGGEMCSSSLFGWKATYYVLGTLTFILSTALAYFYSDSVEDNKHLNENEKKYILSGKHEMKHKESVPYKKMFADTTIWINIIMFVGYYLAMIVYQQYSPTIIRRVLDFSIREAGYFSAIPQLIAILIKVVGGRLLDCNFGVSQKVMLAVPLVFLETLSAIALFLTGFVDDRVLSLVAMLVFASLHFFVPVICSRTIQIRAAQHAHFALNFIVIIAGISQIVIPLGVQAAAPENSREQWSRIFYFLAITVVLTILMYMAFTRVAAAKWTKKAEYTIYRLSDPNNECAKN
ncbi:unnamed protein product [Caenorhabditis bovis]|uniref:Major facilitator superfamily (MFS) profile domain-containing protein n=1 Tax=Caenorhabditis bovis TaxID=2654633 RepID=A0A8S1EYK4_9PELO|nr:unnamed protein product [Caenorhabditis bovis]